LLIRGSNTVIAPSVVASLSEYCAFFLGKDLASRKRILSAVKEVYSERSAGTHGGKVISDSTTEETALAISRSMIFRLLDIYLRKVDSEDKVFSFLEKLKYS